MKLQSASHVANSTALAGATGAQGMKGYLIMKIGAWKHHDQKKAKETAPHFRYGHSTGGGNH